MTINVVDHIDDLLSIVTESVGAYKVCKERIDAVEKALEKALSDTGAAPKEPVRASKPSAPAASGDTASVGDDVPF